MPDSGFQENWNSFFLFSVLTFIMATRDEPSTVDHVRGRRAGIVPGTSDSEHSSYFNTLFNKYYLRDH